MVIYAYGRRALELAFWVSARVVLVQSAITPFLPLSFLFDWNPPGQPYPVPVTAQCETIHIVWGRNTALGPDNIGPYYLQIYTSIYLAPIIIPVGDVLVYDWAVPFPPGTLYQICMFDKNGNPGGCQATYTVTPATTTPTCANVTLPPLLGVDAIVNNGPMSRYGWIEQCTDISVTPLNGTPPYIFTIAPSLHPPYNITSHDMSNINWTVTLSWASPFFLSVVDSAGNMWANGLLHSGSGANTACLSGNMAPAINPHMVKPAVAIGAGAGGLGIGLFLLVAVLFFQRRHRISGRFGEGSTSDHPTAKQSSSTQRSIPPQGSRNRLSTYNIEPFIMPGEEEPLSPEALSPLPTSTGRTISTDSSFNRTQNQIYVVHHDSQAPPVTIYHEDGTRVVELPPRYPASSSGRGQRVNEVRGATRRSDSRSDGERAEAAETRRILREHRRPTVSKKPTQEGDLIE